MPHVERKILNSWKEIASYIGRGVRTVQRYERQFGFPVHRPAGTSRSSVMAFSDEADAWLSQTPTQSAQNTEPGKVSKVQLQASQEANGHSTLDGSGICPFCLGTGKISRPEHATSVAAASRKMPAKETQTCATPNTPAKPHETPVLLVMGKQRRRNRTEQFVNRG